MKRIGAFCCLGSMILIAGCGGSSGVSYANVRTANFVYGAGSVTVTAQTGALGSALSFGTVTAFSQLSTYPQSVTAIDPTNSTSLGAGNLSDSAGNFYTLYAYGQENGTPAPNLELLQDVVPAATTTSANVRFGNFSSVLNQSVDVYVTPSTNTNALSSLTPLFTNVTFGSVATYSLVSGGTYLVRVTPTGNTATILVSTTLTFTNGTDYSLYESDASTTTAQVTLTTDTF